MIYGIGTDIVRIERVEAIYEKFGDHFATRLLLPEEKSEYAKTRRKVRFLAMRFAAKEAIVKAMGTGFAHGVWIRDIGIRHADWGRPEIIFSDRGAAVCARLGIGDGFVSLTDEAGLAVAFAVVERAERIG